MDWIRAHWSRLAAGLALATVAAVTGRVSYLHIYDLTLRLHQPAMVAQLMPFGVDGLIVVGSIVLLQATPGQGRLGWLGIGPGGTISLFANVMSGIRYGLLAAAWAGVPAVSFFLATFILERWLKAQVSRGGTGGQGGTEDAGNVGDTNISPLSSEPPVTSPEPPGPPAGEAAPEVAQPDLDAIRAEVLAEVLASHPQPCEHGPAESATDAVVTAYLHGRDCLGEAPSQRSLSAKFDLSRPKVAELVGSLNGHKPAPEGDMQ